MRMVTNLEELLSLCDEELRHREYGLNYYARITNQWDSLRNWMDTNEFSEFNKDIGNRYCDEMFGTHLALSKAPKSLQEKIRAIRMLISYQEKGDFEFRCPKVEHIFSGEIGMMAEGYLSYCRDVLMLAEKTIENKRFYLYHFCSYMDINRLNYEDLSIEVTEKFFSAMGCTLASRHIAARNIRLFLRYAYDNGASMKDCSVFVLPDNYKKNCKLPTTYEEDEIRDMIAAVERASAIGKRDYLVLLLAAEYGWRSSDITSFCFDDIDWDNNVIHFSQHKTKTAVEFPLLSTVGNAIIDYLKHARPETDAPEIIVSLENANKGKPLSSPTIHSIVTKYLRRAGIRDWEKKKHGPHAMRHSLATNLLKQNVAMPIISTVMGHQRTETTGVYISVDFSRLKQCALPMPVLRSPFYNREGSHGKI